VDDLDNRLPGTPVEVVVEPGTEYTGPPLAEGLPKFLGNVLGSDPNFTRYWNQLTPENEGKWAYIGTVSDTLRWNWSNLDRVYKYAMDNNLIFKNHTLIWGQQQPSWISTMSADLQLKYIEAWIRMVGTRYPDMDMIDVVNEPLKSHNPPDGVNGRANYKNALGGDGQTGWDWVIQSFVLARKYMPNTKLILNDYGIINDNNATSSYLQIINLLKDRGLIDGIGVQGHRFELENASVNTLKYNLDRLAATGLPIYISEMDLGNYGDSGTPDDQVQLQLFQKIFPVLWEHPGVQGITLWGYKEGAMWQTTCFLVRKDNTARPALTWLAGYLKSTATDVSKVPDLSGAGIELRQNYPNPFSTSTVISFDVSHSSSVTLKVYNMLGEEVAQLMNEYLHPGVYNVTWDNNGHLAPGTYIYRLVSGKKAVAKKMVKK
jgi:endo-1,4-beta-xylanase